MKTIVVLGAGLAAVPLIRQTMVNTVLKRDDLKLIVVSPSAHFHWPIAMPRAIVPGQFEDDKVMFSLEPTFKEYPPSKFEFIQGKASSLDTASNLVIVSLNAGGTQSVLYDTLIIATGARPRDDVPWKSLESTEETKAKLHKLQGQIKKAKTDIVAGGGLTGVETAGELGFEYSKDGQKEIIFIHDSPLPLGPPVIDSVRKAAKSELEKLKVTLIPNSTVTKTTTTGDETIVEIRNSDGTTKTLTAQAYVSATGLIPNTEFVPSNLLDSRSYIKQTKFLQAEGQTNIFVVGDAGNLEASKAQTAEAQMVHLISALPVHLDGGKVAEYQPIGKDVFGITVGRSRATGQMGTMKVFSILIWWLKGRFLGTDYAGEWAKGKRTMSKTFEK